MAHCVRDLLQQDSALLTWWSEEGKPQNYMFGEMRRALGISKAIDIIDHIESLPSAEQSVAWHKIETIESEAMVKQEVQPGLVGLLEYLDSKQIRRAICTRNFESVISLRYWPD